MCREDRQSICPKCQNDKNKTKLEDLRKIFKDAGCKLLATEYKNKDEPLKYICICGSESKIRYSDFKHGKRCSQKCKQEKYKKTCQKKYNKDNTFQVEKFKQKARETTKLRYGKEYIMQVKEFVEKAQETNKKKYGKKYAFNLPEVYEKIRKIHLEKYGTEYPLQSNEIQEKISAVFMNNWGAKRPFLSEKFIEKYNKMMIEKYGKPWFVMTDEFKETMIKNWGVPHALQSPILFRKAIKNSFSQKEYISADGKIWFVQGYENVCLDELLTIENINSCEIEAGDSDLIPQIKYYYSLDDVATEHIWYPDIWIYDQKRIIEVKSTWTYNKCPIQIRDKMHFSPYNCELWVYDNNKKLVDIVFFDSFKKEFTYLKGNIFKIGEQIGTVNYKSKETTKLEQYNKKKLNKEIIDDNKNEIIDYTPIKKDLTNIKSNKKEKFK